jgi:galactonate dehydratase
MTADPLRSLTLTIASVTPATRWTFLEVATASGLGGVGEASIAGQPPEVLGEAFAAIAPWALTLADAAPSALPQDYPLPTLPIAAVYSALDQAFWDVAAQRRGVCLAEALGGVRRDAVAVYANINRRTRDRSPEGFAASARDALAVGFEAFKIAPFDEADATARRGGTLDRAMWAGLARIAAVREAIGPRRALMVDCHWRFDAPAAEAVIALAAASNVRWIECPLPETPENIPALRHLRHLANARGMLLAGCEQLIRLEGFAPFLQGGAYDVLMPDVKYAGGLAEMLRLAEAMQVAGVAFSPHNPTGPVSHAASLHVAATVAALDMLEMQFDETPAFDRLQATPISPPRGGAVVLPRGAGLGIILDRAALDGFRTLRFTAP